MGAAGQGGVAADMAVAWRARRRGRAVRSRESGGELGHTRLAAWVRFGFHSQSNEKPSLALSRALAWSDLYSGKIV